MYSTLNHTNCWRSKIINCPQKANTCLQKKTNPTQRQEELTDQIRIVNLQLVQN